MNKVFAVWLAWFLATMFYTYQYILRVLPNIGLPMIIEDFQIDVSKVGLFSAMYYIGYTLMHIPVGLLIDRFSIKKVIPICIFLTSVGLIPLIYSDLFVNAILGRLLIGIASSASVLGIFKVVKRYFGESKFSSLVGMSTTIGLLGAIYGGRPLDYLISLYGWHAVINSFIIIGVIFSIVTFIILPKTPKEEKQYNFSVAEMWHDVRDIFSNVRVVLLSFIGGLMVGPLEGFADTWGTLFFESFYKLGRDHASMLSSIIFVGMCFGSAFIGYITDKTKAHISVVLISNMILIATFLLMFSGQCNLHVLYFLMFIIGVVSAYQISILGKVRDYTNGRLADLTSAACNMIMMIFGTIFHTLIGFITHKLDSIEIGLSVIPGALILAFMLLFINNRGKFFNKKIFASRV